MMKNKNIKVKDIINFALIQLMYFYLVIKILIKQILTSKLK